MIFQYNGLSFDTEKPVFVLGYTTQKHFFISHLVESNKNCELRRLQEHGVKCKRKYVRVVTFSGIAEKNNNLARIGFGTVIDRLYGENEIIIGHSPKECLKIFEEKYVKGGAE